MKELAKQGLITDVKDKMERLKALLGFFSVSSPSAWEKMWTSAAVAYRRSPVFRGSPWATAAWLRIGELAAREQKVAAFDRLRFKQALKRLRTLTLLDPEEIRPKLVAQCAKHGVSVVFVKALPGTHIHGAVRWIEETPVIQLSCRHKAEDLFWFTFFHEAAHVVLHGKREVFLEHDNRDSDKEDEANLFASDLLIPEGQWRAFKQRGRFSEDSVRDFAMSIEISTAIVVGRMQHEGLIAFSRLNHLKGRFDLTDRAVA